MAALEQPLATRLDRRPGQKEERWNSPVMEAGAGPVGRAEVAPQDSDDASGLGDDEVPVTSLSDRMDEVQTDIARLHSEMSELRADLAALRASLGD
jgi:uncharacterized protein YceH (UPF0502 family)